MMRFGNLLMLASVVAATSALPRHAQANGTVQLYGEDGGSYVVRLTSVKELRFRRAFRSTIHQQYDFSCGSAALATLLTYHYGRPVSEQAVFAAMFEAGDQPKIRSQGFSLLDIKRYLERNGYDADGFEATLDQLAEAKTPALALIRENGYNHFIVVKGIYEDRVLIGDPSSGTRILRRAEFEAAWIEKILFVIRNHQESAQFNGAADWEIRLRAPLVEAISRDTLPGLMFPTRNDF
jgi:predicted double-glycine peptidase